MINWLMIEKHNEFSSFCNDYDEFSLLNKLTATPI